MEGFIDKVAQSINKHGLLKPGQRVITTLSGGADSVALLVALSRLGYKCIAAHCNFGLRGEESVRDRDHAAYTASLYASEYREIEFDVDTYKKVHGISTEMACRDLRYEWFARLSDEFGGIPVAVAHHSDDNIETVLLNLLRGTGITGMTGMKSQNGIIIRPMLDIRRNEIVTFLKNENISYVTDSTNLINDVKRNRLRNIIIPAIRNEFPDADKGFDTSISDLRDNASLYEEAVTRLAKNFIDNDVIDVKRMVAETDNPITLLYEIIKPYGFNHTHASDITATVTSDKTVSGRQFFNDKSMALINRGKLHIIPISEKNSEEEFKIDLAAGKEYPYGLTIAEIPVEQISFDRNGKSLYLAPKVLEGNPEFVMRRWREGDRIEPFGMKGSPLVSDIFSDAKLSLDDKRKVWLLTRDDIILWVVGYRTSRHFAVDLSRGGGKAIRLTMP